MTKISTAVSYATIACTNLDQEEKFYRDSLGFDVERTAGVPGIAMVKCGQGTRHLSLRAPDCAQLWHHGGALSRLPEASRLVSEQLLRVRSLLPAGGGLEARGGEGRLELG
jgi:catechol 2,3-dioxygenase-like lactoylglutathione lyase family enzyme